MTNDPSAIPAPPRAAAPAGDRRVAATWSARLAGLLLLLGGAAVLAVAVNLDANPAGYGTHTQLGFSPCGFEASSGVPCATCGMTTAVTLAAHGRLIAAFIVQPAGAMFALAMALSVFVGGWALWTGRSLYPLAAVLLSGRVLTALGLTVALAWAYRVADALLGHPWTLP